MQTFDVLDPKAALLGAKILEASAGTGKTFAIEHLILRLLLEASLQIEEILAITYTRAAAREMRIRIRENLGRALQMLRNGESAWPYLAPYVGKPAAIRQLEEALARFDNAQIFTIHGFCQRMLTEFALEARLHSAREATPLQNLRGEVLDFLESQQAIGPEQMQELMKQKTISWLSKQLLSGSLPSKDAGDWNRDRKTIEEAILSCPYRNVNPEEEFALVEAACKYTGFSRSECKAQLAALKELLGDPASLTALRRLQSERGSLFHFLSLSNRKKGKELAQPPLFDWCIRHLEPLLAQTLDRKRLLQQLKLAWQQPFEKLLEARGVFSPDFLLERMRRSLAYPDFAGSIRKRYQAAIVDEFQDTDALQWEIFSGLFNGFRLFYLVGDPKQSIYRFRQADLYTYYKAKESLGPGAYCSLDTNYRSSPQLVGALNDLFGEKHAEPWLWLPGENRTESYRPVKAGLALSWDPGDGKKSLQFFRTSNCIDYVLGEILRLRPKLSGFSSFAILVQSNQQASIWQEELQRRSLPCAAKSRIPLGSSLALQALEELFNALFFPRDPNSIKLFLVGPLVGAPVEALLQLPDLPQLYFWKLTLERKGVAAFFREFLSTRWEGGASFYETIVGRGSAFFCDFFQLLEQLISKLPQSYEAIMRIFCEIRDADPEEDPSARRRADAGRDAVQILTMHTSKGLEFDVVFALGVSAKTPPPSDEPLEAEAEKLRQLYVALTRAKLRLYIPLVEHTRCNVGCEPPLDLLWKRSKLSGIEKLAELNPNIGFEIAEVLESHSAMQQETSLQYPSESLAFPKAVGAIYSYSSLVAEKASAPLAKLREEKSVHTFPRGAESGTVFHKIFERFFTQQKRLEEIVQDEVRFSNLSGWEEVVLETVQKTLSIPLLEGTSLSDLNRTQVRTETEFFFEAPPHFLKGCIDLLFLWQERLYFLDWKTNWLGESDANYTTEGMQKVMDEHDYWMQASLYAEAIHRAFPAIEMGGAIYLFLRGGTYLLFQPEPLRWPQ